MAATAAGSDDASVGVDEVDARGGDHPGGSTTVCCAECKRSTGLYWQGWRALRSDDADSGEPSALAFYCPQCAMRKFGPPTRRDAA